jgi:hypothetical protein
LTNFRAVAARRGWTLGPYSKGKALWSPDRRFVMFDGVQVERNSVEVQWQRPGEDIATPAIERTEAGEQAVLPGAEKISQGEQPNGAPTMASNPRHHKGRPTKIYLATGEARPIWSTWQGRSRAGPAEDDFDALFVEGRPIRRRSASNRSRRTRPPRPPSIMLVIAPSQRILLDWQRSISAASWRRWTPPNTSFRSSANWSPTTA